MTRVSKKLVIFALVAVLLFECTSCSDGKSVILTMSVKSDNSVVGSGNTAFHTLTVLPENTVTTSGLTSLSFEPSSAAVCVTELTKGNVWSVLPLFENSAASAVDVVLRTSDCLYSLNSQDNSVAYGSYKYELLDNGVTVEYLIADRTENASGSVSAVKDGAAVKLSVTYTLTDGDLRVSVDCGKIELSDGAVLESIALMPYFGAIGKAADGGSAELEKAVLSSAQENAGIPDGLSSGKTETETDAQSDETETGNDGTGNDKADSDSDAAASPDFLLVPDGCGAIMYTDKEDENTNELEFDVYKDGTNGARIPVFGVKKGSGAFVAIIGDGAATAAVKARRAEKDVCEAATVYPEFTVTEHSELGTKYNYAEPYDGLLSVCYRFMSGSEANYISMAAVCREELIRNGTLSSRTLESDDYPLNISVTVSVDGTAKKTASTFEETEDMLQLLKAKGVENVELILNGMFSGGLARDNSDVLGVLRSAGGLSGLKKLYEYAAMQKFKVFAGVTLVKTSGGGGKTATDLDGKKIASVIENPLAPYMGSPEYSVGFVSADRIEKNTVSLMTEAEKLSVSGLCILDADIGAYTDGVSGMTSSDTAEMISKNISAFSTRKELALSGGAFNTVKNASLIADIPLTAGNAESEAYVAVPLIPAVLHSTVLYSGSPVNTGSTDKLDLLKCVEYGAQPYYLWVFDSGSHYYYENTFNDAVDFVLGAADKLADLVQCRIVSHTQTEDNVFCTGYDNGALVYVNYNNYSVNIGDISVLPYDYIRIN